MIPTLGQYAELIAWYEEQLDRRSKEPVHIPEDLRGIREDALRRAELRKEAADLAKKYDQGDIW